MYNTKDLSLFGGLKDDPYDPWTPFPMLDGPKIPIELAREIYRVYVALYGNSQSLEQIGEHGGFRWNVVPLMWKEFHRKFRRNP